MQAVVCTQFGSLNFVSVRDVPASAPSDTDVVVSVKAAGLNFRDLLTINNAYQMKLDVPFVLGCELAGVVLRTGKDVNGVSAGDRVIGYTASGACAEEACVDMNRVFLIPDGMTDIEAAGFLVPYGTAAHALLHRGSLARDETLLVLCGASGVGLAAIEIGKAIGARVIACASTDARLSVCTSHGADAAINYVHDNLRDKVNELTVKRGVDVVFDPSGGGHTEMALRSLRWNGRLLVIGFASGDIPKIAMNIPLLKGSAIVGVLFSEFARREPDELCRLFEHLVAWFKAGSIRPHVSIEVPMSRVGEALEAMANRALVGKAVVVV